MHHEGDEEPGRGGGGGEVVDQEGLLRLCVGKGGTTTNNAKTAAAGKRTRQYKKPKEFYFSLLGGSLHYYKQAESPEPSGTIVLGEMTLTPQAPGDDEGEGEGEEELCFRLANDKLDFLLIADGEEDYQAWVAALTANRDKEARPPLPKEKAEGRFQRFTRRTTKNLAGRAASSQLGKRAIRNKLPKEITELIGALKAIIQMESKSAKKAERVEDNIYRIGVKMYFLIADKKIRIEDLAVMDTPFRQALALFSKIRFQVHVKRDNNADINLDGLREKLGEVKQLVAEAGDALKKLLVSHMKPKNVERIDEIISYVTDPEVVVRVLLDPLLDDELFDLESAAKHYSQFYYYADGS